MKVLRSEKKSILELDKGIKNDRDWSLYCRQRDRGICRIGLPGCKKVAIEVHHIFTRSIQSLRLNPLNGLSVCRNCHNKLESDQLKNFEVCRKVLGEEDFNKLYLLYKKQEKIDVIEYYKRIKK